MARVPSRLRIWRRSRLFLGVFSCLVILALQFSPVAIANMASPSRAGDLLSEPWADVSSLDILHEDLVFDLRPLADLAPAQISATYQINNPGAATTLDLLFVAPGIATGQVTLNGQQAIAATSIEAPEIPAEWNIDSPPPLNGLQFQVPLSSGEQTITVQYTGHPDSDDRDIYRIYDLTYWLSPARQWRSFGTLTVDVFAPAGWQAAFEPDLSVVEPQHWRATFTGLPADQLTLTTYLMPSRWLSLVRLALLGTSLAAAAVITWRAYYQLGRFSQRAHWSGGLLVLACLFWIPLSIPLVWSISGLGVGAAELLLDQRQLAVGYSYGRLILWVGVGLMEALIAPVIASIQFAIGRRSVQS
ncbi:MAG: hypothetical protein ACFB0G_11500 [Leptolyngbyaceae cyanobacterium]